MQVQPKEAVKMLIEMGFKHAGDFNPKKLSVYLNELEARSEGADKPTTAECVALRKNILAALKEEEEIIVMTATKTKKNSKTTSHVKPSKNGKPSANGKAPVEKDNYGFRVGMAPALIMASLGTKPQTAEQIGEKAGIPAGKVTAYFSFWKTKGHPVSKAVVAKDEGYALKEVANQSSWPGPESRTLTDISASAKRFAPA